MDKFKVYLLKVIFKVPEKVDLDLYKPLDNELQIDDIDKALYDFGMMYRYDINNIGFDKYLMKARKLISLTFFIHELLSAIRFFIYIKLTDGKRVPDYCFDFIQEAGGFIIYFYFVALDVSLWALCFNYYLNTAKEQHLKWILILRVLKGLSPINDLKINNYILVKNFIIRINLIHKTFKYIIETIRISFLLMIIIIIVFKYNLHYFIKYGLISSIIFYFWVYFTAPMVYYVMEYIYIICNYCRTRVNSINKKTIYLTNKFFKSYQLIDKLLEEYNDMFNTINDYNRFLKKIYLIFILCLIPYDLILLHQILFEDLPIQTLIAITLTLVFSLFLQSFLNSISASVSNEVSKSEKLIRQLMIKSGIIVNNTRKLKV